jgi:hypothetical protein
MVGYHTDFPRPVVRLSVGRLWDIRQVLEWGSAKGLCLTAYTGGLVGAYEIGEMLQLKLKRVGRLVNGYQFPAPVQQLGDLRVWDLDQVVGWCRWAGLPLKASGGSGQWELELDELACSRCGEPYYGEDRGWRTVSRALRQLLQRGCSPEPQVRNSEQLCAVAASRDTSPETLRSLSTNPVWQVRHAVATNPMCPTKLLRALAQDENHIVRGAAANRTATQAPASQLGA